MQEHDIYVVKLQALKSIPHAKPHSSSTVALSPTYIWTQLCSNNEIVSVPPALDDVLSQDSFRLTHSVNFGSIEEINTGLDALVHTFKGLAFMLRLVGSHVAVAKGRHLQSGVPQTAVFHPVIFYL